MNILVNVANQKLKIATNLKSLVAGTQEFVRFTFNLTNDWDDLTTFAQFKQNGVAYNVYLDENNSAYLPSEIGAGTCTLMLYGSNDETVAITNYLTLSIYENILVSDENGLEIRQLVINLQSQIDAANADISTLKAKDDTLQSQIDALGGVDVSELQSQIDTKVDKVEGKGLSTNDYNDRAKEKVDKIGRTNLIPSDSRDIVQWIQDVYDSVFTSSAENVCLADRLQSQIYDKANKTDISALKAKDTDLQSQIDTKVTRKVAIVGSDTANSAGWYKVASGTMTKWTSLSLLFAVHTPATSGKHSGILQLDLRGGTEAIEIGDTLKLGWLVRAGFDLSQVIVVVDGYDWELYYKVQSPVFFRAFFEVIQESNDVSINKAVYTLYTDSVVETTAPVATATSTDLGTVNTANKLTTARNINGIAFDGSKDINITANDIKDRNSSQTISDTIVKLRETDTNLQSQIDAFGGVDVSELQSQIDTKVDKVEGKGLSTNDYNDRAKEKVDKIGRTNLIPSDSRDIVQWIQDVYDSVFTSSAENVCLADRLQSQIYDKANKTDISALKAKDTDLQSQIDTKVTRKVAVAGSDIESSAGWYKVASGTMAKYQVISLLFAVHTPATSGKHSGILQLDLRGGTESIDAGDALKLGWLARTGFDSSQVIVTVDGYNWALYYKVQSPRFFRAFFEVIQESSGTSNKATYNLHTDSVVETTAPVATATSVDLGTVNTANKLTTARNINGIAFDGSADINITANDIASTSGPEHNLAYEIGMTKADLSALEASIGTWSSGQTISGTISSMKESIKDIDMNADLTKSDLDAVKARIGSWSTSQTLYGMIADLTARIEALEENSGGGSGGVSQAVLIDWDVNTNGATQGTTTKDATGLHASGDKSLRIANYWNCDVSAYDGITFTAYGSGELRVEVGGVEGEYKTLGTTPTTYTIAFADIGLTELSGIEINLQTQGVYDLTVSDIFGYTNI